MSRILLTLSIFFLLVPFPSQGAVNTRPLSGSGLLLVHPLPSAKDNSPLLLKLYREPEVGQLMEIDGNELPSLAKIVKTAAREYPLLVTRSRGRWLRIVYDEAGREGWLRQERQWKYQSWEMLLKGKPVHLLAGLKKGYYQLHATPSTKSARQETLSSQRKLRVVEVEGDWALVIVDLATSGWLRWRDDDGRFLIAIDEQLSSKRR